MNHLSSKKNMGLAGAFESGLIIIAAICCGLTGCGDDNDKGCSRNSDCPADQSCSDWDEDDTTPNSCYAECVEDRDCFVGGTCVGGYCAERCRLDSDCPDGTYCSDEGRCTYQCRIDRDCAGNEHGRTSCNTQFGQCEEAPQYEPDAGINEDAN